MAGTQLGKIDDPQPSEAHMNQKLFKIIALIILSAMLMSTGFAYADDVQFMLIQNPRDEFRRLGWKVYDDVGLTNVPKKKYKYRTTANTVKKSVMNDALLDKLAFIDVEKHIFRQLLDGRSENDELSAIFVTADNYLVVNIKGVNKAIGRKGVYLVFKKLSPRKAHIARKISPDYTQ